MSLIALLQLRSSILRMLVTNHFFFIITAIVIYLMIVRPSIIRTTMLATHKMQQIPFIDLVNKSALHVSGDKFAHPQEQFSTV